MGPLFQRIVNDVMLLLMYVKFHPASSAPDISHVENSTSTKPRTSSSSTIWSKNLLNLSARAAMASGTTEWIHLFSVSKTHSLVRVDSNQTTKIHTICTSSTL